MPISRILFSRPLFTAGKLNSLRRCISQNVFNISDTAVQAYLKTLMIEHEHLCTKIKRTPEESKRLFEIKPIVNVIEQRINLHDNIELLSKMQSNGDEDMKEKIKKEAQSYMKRMTDVDRDLQSILLEPRLTKGGVLLEITAGAGGQDVMLFARELFEMYDLYAKYKDWEVCTVSIEKTEIGGFRKASMFIEGEGVPELMKLEAGVHRAQRIPAIEMAGCVYTSTVSVAVLPKPTDIEVNIPDHDIVIENKLASGADGQHVNTTDSAVRITHTPTGIVVECKEGTSQIEKKEIAIQKLRTLLWQRQQQEQKSKINSQVETQIGFSDRNEPVRTYNYPEDIVAEHREGGGIMRNLQGFMEGDYLLEQMQTNLLRVQRRHELFEEINQLAEKIDVKSADTN